MSQSRQTINAISLDFDGCIFNVNYVQNPEHDKRVITSNNDLITAITNKITAQAFTKAILLVGSNRQDKTIDDLNAYSHNKGSAFPALRKLHEEFTLRLSDHDATCEIDEYLLADSYGRMQPGETFRACIENNEHFIHQRWFFDDQKLSLLYAQMHKISSENPHADITFDFYDDRHDIHDALSIFLNEHPNYIPKNISLNLNHYDGEHITHRDSIQGTGIIDYNYHANLFKMLQHAKIPHEQDKNKKLIINDDFIARNQKNANVLLHFKKQNCAKDFITEVAEDNINMALGELLEAISTTADPITDPTTEDALKKRELLLQYQSHLKILYDKLAKDIQNQVTAGASSEAINDSSAMQVARETTLLLKNCRSPNLSQAEALQHINTYEANCKKTARWTNFWKAIAVVAMFAVGVVVGGAIGIAIGIAAGAWTGPGAVATALGGMFMGAATGATIGIAIGSAATGMVASAVTAGLLFRDNEIDKHVSLVADQSRNIEASRTTLSS